MFSWMWICKIMLGSRVMPSFAWKDLLLTSCRMTLYAVKLQLVFVYAVVIRVQYTATWYYVPLLSADTNVTRVAANHRTEGIGIGGKNRYIQTYF